MSTTQIRLGHRSPKLIRRIAALATLSVVGIVGAQAGETPPVSLSEEVCLSCAYENGLDRSNGAAVAPGAVVTEEPLADASADHGASVFGRRETARSSIVLPTGRNRHAERLPFSRGEKALMWSFVSLSAVDAYQTMNAPGHVREANPLLASWAGDHPSAFETVAFKGATAYGMYKLAGRIKKRSTRRLALVMMNFVQLSVAAHNEQVTGGVLF